MTDAITPAAVAIGVPLFLWLLVKYGPRNTITPERGWPSLENMERLFARTQWEVTVVSALVALLFGLSAWWALWAANRWWGSLDGTAVFRFYPSAAWWVFCPALASLLLAWPITALLLHPWLGPLKARQYLYWTNTKAGFDTVRAFWLLGFAAGGILLFATLPALPVHASFFEDRLTLREYGTWQSKTYAYQSVRRVITTAAQEVVLEFDDGTRWRPSDALQDSQRELDVNLRDFLVRKSGRAYEYIPELP